MTMARCWCRYQPGSETPEQLAEAVHRALAAGWNCTARVDRGEAETDDTFTGGETMKTFIKLGCLIGFACAMATPAFAGEEKS